MNTTNTESRDQLVALFHAHIGALNEAEHFYSLLGKIEVRLKLFPKMKHIITEARDGMQLRCEHIKGLIDEVDLKLHPGADEGTPEVMVVPPGTTAADIVNAEIAVRNLIAETINAR